MNRSEWEALAFAQANSLGVVMMYLGGLAESSCSHAGHAIKGNLPIGAYVVCLADCCLVAWHLQPHKSLSRPADTQDSVRNLEHLLIGKTKCPSGILDLAWVQSSIHNELH